MKRFIFGIMVTIIGLLFFAFTFFYRIVNPGIYNGIDGLLGSLLCADLTGPFVISLGVLVVGIIICAYEAYR